MDNEKMYNLINAGIDIEIRPALDRIINSPGKFVHNPITELESIMIETEELLESMEESNYDLSDPLYNNLYNFYVELNQQFNLNITHPKNRSEWVNIVKEMSNKYFPITNQESIQNNVEIVK